MPKEIERKFLVRSDKWRDRVSKSSVIRQAIVFSDNGSSLRVRIIDDHKARLTVKMPISEQSRHEFEYEIPLGHADELFALAKGATIHKTRHLVKHKGHVWEIDCFGGALEGLMIAEVEMEDESERPDLPSWLGREVTADPRFKNYALAEGSLGENWRDEVTD